MWYVRNVGRMRGMLRMLSQRHAASAVTAPSHLMSRGILFSSDLASHTQHLLHQSQHVIISYESTLIDDIKKSSCKIWYWWYSLMSTSDINLKVKCEYVCVRGEDLVDDKCSPQWESKCLFCLPLSHLQQMLVFMQIINVLFISDYYDLEWQWKLSRDCTCPLLDHPSVWITTTPCWEPASHRLSLKHRIENHPWTVDW